MKNLLRTLTGKNKTGQIIYGVLDILPIPPIHNLIRTAYSNNEANKIAFIWQKLDKLRLTTSIIAFIMAILTIKGYFTEQELFDLLKILTEILR